MKFSRPFLPLLLAFSVCGIAIARDTTVGSAQTKVRLAQSSTDSASKRDVNRPVRDKWALIVGISEFASDKIPKLKYATKDARDFYNYLVHEAHFAPDHVRLLLNEKATQRRIISELGNKFLARLARSDDMIVLFFSTHGSPSQLDLRGQNYVVAYDSDPEDLYATGIEMKKILESIQDRVLSDRVLLVLDACHSGSAGPDAKGIMRVANFDAQALAEGSGQMVICSSRPDEQSWESRRYENGVFTKSLLHGLRSAGSATPISKAFEVTQQLVQNEVKEDHPGIRQSPVLHSKWSGNELILAVKPSAPERVPATVVSDLDPDSTVATAAMAKAVSSAPPRGVTRAGLRSEGKLVLTREYFSNEPDPKAALKAAYEAKAAHFNDVQAYLAIAKVQIQLGKFSSAMQQLKDVLTDDPNIVEAYLARAYCFHKMGLEGNAKADLKMAIEKGVTLPKDIEFGD